MTEEAYFDNAMSFLKKLGLYEKENTGVRGSRFMVESRPAEKSDAKVIRRQKNATVKLQCQIKVGSHRIDVLGEGGRLFIQLNNDGSVINASLVWRDIMAEKAMSPIKHKEKALHARGIGLDAQS